MRELAKQYAISDVALAKWCKKLRIPVPGRGHWAKKAAGKGVRQPPLPQLPSNDPTVDRSIRFAVATEPRTTPALPEPLELRSAFEKDPANKIVVADALRSPHPLVRTTLAALAAAAKARDQYAHNRQTRYLDLDVTGAQFHRASRVMDALVKAFERRGWVVTLGAGDDRHSYVTIFDQRIPFGIRETLKKVENEKPKPQQLRSGEWYEPYFLKRRDEPSGRLALVIRNSWGHGAHKSWPETESRPIEERLNAFALSLSSYAYEEQQRGLRFAEEERVRRATEKRRIEGQQLRERELAKQRALEHEAENWEKSQRIRAYLSAVRETAVARFGEIDPLCELAQWLSWAADYAGSLDPMRVAEGEISGRKVRPAS